MILNFIYIPLLLVNKVLNFLKIILENFIDLKIQLNKSIGLIKKHLSIEQKTLNFKLKLLLYLILQDGIVMLANIYSIINKNNKNGQMNGENFNLPLINS